MEAYVCFQDLIKKSKHKPFLNINSLQKYLISRDQLNKISKKHKLISVNEKKVHAFFLIIYWYMVHHIIFPQLIEKFYFMV